MAKFCESHKENWKFIFDPTKFGNKKPESHKENWKSCQLYSSMVSIKESHKENWKDVFVIFNSISSLGIS